MSQWVRHLIIWIVAALLPLQAYAAAAMISCGPMHAQVAMQSHGHDGHENVHHGHQALPSDPVDSDESITPLPDLFKFKCSACAACCTGALAFSTLAPLSAVMRVPPDVIPFSDSSDEGIVPDTLERPPRTSLA